MGAPTTVRPIPQGFLERVKKTQERRAELMRRPDLSPEERETAVILDQAKSMVFREFGMKKYVDKSEGEDGKFEDALDHQAFAILLQTTVEVLLTVRANQSR